MRRLTHLTSLALLSALMSSCAEQPPPTGIGFGPDDPDDPPISFASRKIRGGGFDGEGNSGAVGDWPPSGWILAVDIGESPEFEDWPKCLELGHCPVGDIVQWFAGLREPINPDPNPDDAGGGFAVISTTNFHSDNGTLIVTNQSAIKKSFPLRPRGRWQLQVDLAFLTGEIGTGAQNDFATIRIRPVTSGEKVTVIRLEANDPLAWKRGGCRWQSLGGITSNYPRCTDWRPYSVDVSRFSGQQVEVEIRVGEGGIDNGIATSLAVDNLKFVQINLLPQVGQISLSPSTPLAGRSVEARAEFTDGDARDTHRAVWNWGDGSTSPGNVTQGAGFGSVRNNHVYSKPGTYTITLTVIDNDSGRGTRRRQISVQAAGG